MHCGAGTKFSAIKSVLPFVLRILVRVGPMLTPHSTFTDL